MTGCAPSGRCVTSPGPIAPGGGLVIGGGAETPIVGGGGVEVIVEVVDPLAAFAGVRFLLREVNSTKRL